MSKYRPQIPEHDYNGPEIQSKQDLILWSVFLLTIGWIGLGINVIMLLVMIADYKDWKKKKSK